MKKHNMSHNACYDYSKCCWIVQPGDIVTFLNGYHAPGEVLSLSRDFLTVRRLKDNRIFVISTFDMKDWFLSRCNSIRRLPCGIFSVGDRVCLDGELNLPDDKYIIEKFDCGRVKVHYFVNGRSVGWYFVRECEVLKYLEVE